MAHPGPPTLDELRRMVASGNARRLAWDLFQKHGRRAAHRMIRDTEDSRTTSLEGPTTS